VSLTNGDRVNLQAISPPSHAVSFRRSWCHQWWPLWQCYIYIWSERISEWVIKNLYAHMTVSRFG
jgi:hypothetical protein